VTHEERSELVLKTLGIVLLAWGLSWAPMTVRHVLDALRNLRFEVEPQPAVLIYMTGVPLLDLLLALALLSSARPLARWLLPGPSLPAPGETLRAGAIVIGLVLLRTAAVLALTSLGEFLRPPGGLRAGFALAPLALAVALAFVLAPRALPSLISRVAAGIGSFLGAGVALVGLWVGVRALFWLGGAVAQTRQSTLQEFMRPGEYRAWLVGNLVNCSAALLLAIGLLVCAARLARRFGRARRGLAADLELGSVSGATVLATAVWIAAFWLFLAWVRSQSRPGAELDGAQVVSYALGQGILFTILLLAALLVAGFVAWPVGGWLHRGDDGAPDVSLVSARIGAEVALALLALRGIVVRLQSFTSSLGRSPATWPEGVRVGVWSPNMVPVVFLALVLLFRTDLARLLTWRRRPLAEPTVALRRSTLRPWLALLGLYLILTDGPWLVSWGVQITLFGPSQWGSTVPPWGAAAGIALFLGSGWLAGVLAYGPVLPRIWRPIRRP
jgi:hypothetical protein